MVFHRRRPIDVGQAAHRVIARQLRAGMTSTRNRFDFASRARRVRAIQGITTRGRAETRAPHLLRFRRFDLKSKSPRPVCNLDNRIPV
jgi:hypothetical protein